MSAPRPGSARLRRSGSAYVADGAVVVGRVSLGEDASVWYGAVVRGDDAPIRIGPRTNLQDGVLVHADPDVPNEVGAEVTVGHGAVLHGARVGDLALIGMGAVLLSGSVVGEGALVAAGTVVPEGFEVPPWSLVVGVPARVVRTLDREARTSEARRAAADYVERAREHAEGVWDLPPA